MFVFLCAFTANFNQATQNFFGWAPFVKTNDAMVAQRIHNNGPFTGRYGLLLDGKSSRAILFRFTSEPTLDASTRAWNNNANWAFHDFNFIQVGNPITYARLRQALNTNNLIHVIGRRNYPFRTCVPDNFLNAVMDAVNN